MPAPSSLVLQAREVEKPGARTGLFRLRRCSPGPRYPRCGYSASGQVFLHADEDRRCEAWRVTRFASMGPPSIDYSITLFGGEGNETHGALHGFLNTQTSSWGTLNLAFAPFRMPGHSTCTRPMSCSPCRCNSSACHADTRTISPLRMWFLTLTTNTPPLRSTRMHSAQIRLCASRYASPHCIWPVLAGWSGRPRAWRYVYRLDPSRALRWSAMRLP